MSYKLFLPRVEGNDWSRGEYWRSEDFWEHYSLCDHQTIGPVFERWLPKGGKVLEAGCGIGRWLVWLRRRGYEVFGLDLSQEALDRIRCEVADLPLMRANALAIPAPAAVFDAILSLGVVEHDTAGPERALSELRRVLKPGGLLFLSVPFNNRFRRLLFNQVLRGAERLFRHRGRAMEFAEYRFDCGEITGFLRSTGFEPLVFGIDELAPPRSIGLWIDLARLFAVPGRSWQLNRAGQLTRSVCDAISPWLTAGCVLCVARAI